MSSGPFSKSPIPRILNHGVIFIQLKNILILIICHPYHGTLTDILERSINLSVSEDQLAELGFTKPPLAGVGEFSFWRVLQHFQLDLSYLLLYIK